MQKKVHLSPPEPGSLRVGNLMSMHARRIKTHMYDSPNSPPPPSNFSVVTRPDPPLPFIKININTHTVRIDTPTSSLWTSEELPARSAPN
jgi:hypothetical protein